MAILCHDESCPAGEFELSLKTAQHETAYEKAIAQIRCLTEGEGARIGRVHSLLLETDRDLLHLRCDQASQEISTMLDSHSSLRQQLLDAHNEISSLQSSLRTSYRTVQDLKTELASQSRKTVEYDKVSADKLALAKELSTLRQETDRLHGQNNSHQTLVAEKLALERQLNSFEVQMQNERRAFDRSKLLDSKDEEIMFREQLEEIQAELSRESAERSRLEKENRARAFKWEAQKRGLEDKLQSLRKQLRSTKDKLRETKNELQKPSTILTSDRTSQIDQRVQNIQLNRAASRFNPGITIATPGAVHVTGKTKRPSAIPGDKSGFSITPYLRRTKPEAGSSSSSEDGTEDDRVARDALDRATGLDHGNYPDEPSRSSFMNVHNDSTNDGTDDDNDEVVGLGEVPDDRFDNAVTRGPGLIEGKQRVSAPSAVKTSMLNGQQIQRKRKLLGSQRERTLFNDDDEKPEGETKEKVLVPGQSLGAKRSNFSIPRGFDATTGFSPLKRPKRVI